MEWILSRYRQDVSILFNDYAELYNIIASDRDFSEEVNLCLSFLPISSVTTSIELFAGKALHSFALAKLNIKTIALDESISMKKLSESYFKSNSLNIDYVTGALPNGINNLNLHEIDLITIFRFGLGYLSPHDLMKLLENIFLVNNFNGYLSCEIHSAISIGDQFDDLSIHIRKYTDTEYGNIICQWPSEKITWLENLAWMPVDINFSRPQKKELYFNASEYIYNSENIVNFLPEGLNYKITKFTDYSDMIIISNNNVDRI